MAHAWFGANSSFAALVLSAAGALILIAFFYRASSRDLLSNSHLSYLAGLLALVLGIGLCALIGLTPGAPHPIWDYVAAMPATTIDRSGTIVELIKLLGFGCILVVGAMIGADRRLLVAARQLIVWGGAAFSLWALLIFLAGRQVSGHRLMGAFGSPNSAATVIGILILLALPNTLKRPASTSNTSVAESWLARAPQLAILLLLAGCFILTASRWGSISLAVALLTLLFVQLLAGRMKVVHVLASGVALAVAGGGLILLKGQLLIERVGDTVLAHDARSQIFALHWANFLNSPLFGYGLGTFAEVNRLILDAQNFAAAGNVRDLHNVYLQWLVEAGLLGAAPMFLLVATLIGVTLWRSRNLKRNRAWLSALIAADLMVLAHGLSDFALQTPSIAAFWSLLLGLQFGLASAPRRAIRTG